MCKTSIVGLAFAVSLAVSATDAFAEELKRENKLLGTWKLVSNQLPDGFTEDSRAVHMGVAYEEVPEYGVGEGVLEALKRKKQSFKWNIEGNKWHHTGMLSTGQAIEEVWVRVEKR